jgi:cell division protein FtsN
MAKRRKRRSSRKKKRDDYPGWVWLSFGLTIGLSVALAVYVKDRTPTNAADRQSSLDDNGEFAAQQPTTEEPATTMVEDAPKKRFDFYDMLPAFEIIVPDAGPAINEDVEPKAIEEPGVYMLQAGSFSTHEDADRRRAELAFHGIESRVQRARVNDREYYRVYVGPIEDLDELNMLRSRLRAAKIDVLRIRLGD